MTATPSPAYPYTPDTPTPTAAPLRAHAARASQSHSSPSVGPDADGHRQSRFMEEGLAPTRQSPAPSSPIPSTSATTTPVRPTSINPASIPTRTSSSRAFSNSEPQHQPASPSSPRSVKNLMTFPEEGKHRMSGIGGATGGEQSTMDTAPPVGQDLIHGDGSRWTPEKENIVKGPFDYLESHPGKDVRTQLIDAFNLWLQVPPASLAIINKVIGMLHTASLLIDDVEDNSNLRRGVPVAHSIFGTAQTINSANYIYFCALQELSLLPDPPAAIRIYTDELLNLHRGQGMDLFWRDTLTCPSEDDYLEMVGNKTGGLFRLAIKLMHACSPVSHLPINYVPLVNTIGLLFQILDDYRNLSSPSYTSNKGLCEDLTEGKFSFPIIHAIRAAPSNLVLINILKQKPSDDEVKKYAVQYMERVGSFAYTRRVLRGLTRKALGLVEEVDGGRGEGGGVRGILEMLRVEKEGRGKEVRAGGVA